MKHFDGIYIIMSTGRAAYSAIRQFRLHGDRSPSSSWLCSDPAVTGVSKFQFHMRSQLRGHFGIRLVQKQSNLIWNLSFYHINIKVSTLQKQIKQNPASIFTGFTFCLSTFIVSLYVFLPPEQGYSWYCLSVAVKKSSRTLLRYSKVGLSSGFSLQHRPMTL